MLLGVLDYLFRHYFALEASERAFDRFTLINSNYCHSFSVFVVSFNLVATSLVAAVIFNTSSTPVVKLSDKLKFVGCGEVGLTGARARPMYFGLWFPVRVVCHRDQTTD